MSKRPVIIAVTFLALPIFAWQVLPALSETNRNELEADALLATCIAMNNPNTKNFDWDSVSSDEEFQQCLLVMAKSFEHREAMADWLRVQGFSNVSTVSNTPNRVYLNAIWDVKQTGSTIPFAVNLSIFQRLLIRGKNYIVQIAYERETPISATAHHEIK